MVNSKIDKKLKQIIFKSKENKKIITESKIKLYEVFSYQKAYSQIKKLNPDILIVHTGAWVGKEVREIESVKYIIGGHPGITPYYRGSHSPFWAIYNDDESNIGWTCFVLDKGVDTGPVIKQGRITPNKVETYMSLSWRGMVEIAKSQVEAVRRYELDGKISLKEHEAIPENSEYPVPTFFKQIKYWLKQSRVR